MAEKISDETISNNDNGKKKKRIIALIALLTAVLICIAVVLFLIFGDRLTALSIRIQRMVGTVNLYDPEGKSLSMIERMHLRSGQSMTTADESLIMLSLDETKLMTLEQASKARIVGRRKKLEFQLTEGSMFFNITEKIAEDELFEIRTSTMLCGIRGTSAYVGKDEAGRDILMVTDGIVAVTGENPRTHEIIKTLVYAGQQITIYLDDEAEGDATISFRLQTFKEEDLPALALDAIQKDAALQARISASTGFSTEKLTELAKVSSKEGTSMFGSAADELYAAGITDAIPIMGHAKFELVRAANRAVNTAGKDLPLEIAILKGMRNVMDTGIAAGCGQNELTPLMDGAGTCVSSAVEQARAAGLASEDLQAIAEAVTDTLSEAVGEMKDAALTQPEITQVMEAITTVYTNAIGAAVQAQTDPTSLIRAVSDASEYARETVKQEMQQAASGEETVVALLGTLSSSTADDESEAGGTTKKAENAPAVANAAQDVTPGANGKATPAKKPAAATGGLGGTGGGNQAGANAVTSANAGSAGSVAVSANPGSTGGSDNGGTGSAGSEDNEQNNNSGTGSGSGEGSGGGNNNPPGPTKYAISVSAGEGGSAQLSASEAEAGQTVTVTAVPDDAHEFAGWSDPLGNAGIGGQLSNASVTFTMPAGAVSLHVSFVDKNAQKYGIAYSYAVTNGTVAVVGANSLPGGIYEAAAGKTITLTPSPADHYVLKGLTVGMSGTAVALTQSGSSYTFVMPAGDVSIGVIFGAETYNIVYETDGGTIVAGNVTSYAYGTGTTLPTNVTKPETAQYTYTFGGWFLSATGGTQITQIGPTEAGDKKFYAHWTPVTRSYGIALSNPVNGSFSASVGGSAVTQAAVGSIVTLTLTPDIGYEPDTVTVTGPNGAVNVAGTGTTRTFAMPTGAVTVAATFKLASYTVSVSTMTNGTVNINKPSAKMNETVTLTVVPETGYELATLSVKNSAGQQIAHTPSTDPSVSSYTFSMPVGSVTISATFSPKSYSVTLDPQGGVINAGNITGYVYGTGATLPTNVTRQDTAEYSFAFDGWYTLATGGTQVTSISATDTDDKEFFAHWNQTAKSYAISYTNGSGAGGTITPKVGGSTVSTAAFGSTVTVDIVPETGYDLTSLTYTPAGGSATAITASNGVYSFTMPAASVTLAATFVQHAYGITINSSGGQGCSLTADNNQAHYGDTVTLTIGAGTGYELQSLIVSGTNGTVNISGTGNTRTFSMPASEVTVNATFRASTWGVTLNTNGGTINSGNVTAYTYGVGATLPTNVTRAPSATKSYGFAGWFTEETGGTQVTSISASATGSKQFWAHWDETDRGLSITISSVSNGSLAASVNGAVVSEAAANATVTLTATPDPGYELGTVTVSASGGPVTVTGTGNTRTFTMPAEEVTVNAGFTLIGYSVGLSTMTNGSVVRDRPTAHRGETVTLSVSADPGFELDTLTVTKAGGGTVRLSGNGSVRTFTMPAENVTVAATFKTANYVVVLVTDGGVINNGNVTGYFYGVGATLPTDVTKAASAGKAYTFDGWFTAATGGSRVGAIGAAEYGNKVFYAHYTETALPFAITITPSAHGTVTAEVSSSPVTSALKETTVTLSVVPETNYRVVSVTVTDASGRPVSVNSSNGTFVMPGSAVTVEAEFVEQSVTYYTVTSYNAMNPGPVSVTPDRTDYEAGDTVTLTVTTASGYLIGNVGYITSSDYQTSSTWPTAWTPVTESGGSYSFTMPADDVLVRADYIRDMRHDITLDYYATGGTLTASVSGTPVTRVSSSTVVTLFAKADAGYEFDPSDLEVMIYDPDDEDMPYWPVSTLSLQGGSDSEGYTFTFTMPSYDVVVYAPFLASAQVPHTITVDSTITHGSIRSSRALASEGEAVALTATPANGYVLDRVTVTDGNGTNVPVSDLSGSLSFNMPASNVTVTASFIPIYRISTQFDAGKIADIKVTESSSGAAVTDGVPAGTGVSLAVKLTNQNFDLEELLVTDAAGNPVTVRYEDEGMTYEPGSSMPGSPSPLQPVYYYYYSFTMPASSVTVRATARAQRLCTITAQTAQYWDGQDYVNGITGGTFSLDRTSAAPGETVTLTATPASGYYCWGWELFVGSNFVAGEMMADNTSEIVFPGDEGYSFALYVYFEPVLSTTHVVSLSSSADPYITPDKTSAAAGETVTLTVSPATGEYCSYIELLDVDEDPLMTVYSGSLRGGTVRFTMPDEDVIIDASFIEMYTITPDYYTGGGTVTVDAYAIPGDVVPVRVTPGTGYTLDSVEITYTRYVQTGTEVNGKTGEVTPVYAYVSTTDTVSLTNGVGSFTMPNSDVTLHAVFTPSGSTSHSVTVDPSITNGTVTASVSSAGEGDTVTLEVSAASGYRLDTLEVTDASGNELDVTGEDDVYSFYMPDSDVTVTASFGRLYSITYVKNDVWFNGYPPATATVGELISLSVNELSSYSMGYAPNKSARLDSLRYSYVDQGETVTRTIGRDANGNYPFIMPAADVTVTAYKTDLYSAQVVAASGNGTWTSTPSMVEMYGDIAYTITPAAGYVLDRIGYGTRTYYTQQGTYATIETSRSEQFASPTKNANGTYSFTYQVSRYSESYSMYSSKTIPYIWLYFVPEYSITVSDSITGGTVSANKTSAKQNETVTLTVTPGTGGALKSLTVTGSGAVPVNYSGGVYTFTMPAHTVTVSATFTTSTNSTSEGTDSLADRLAGNEMVTVDTDETIDGDLTVPSGKALTIAFGVTVNITGTLTIADGAVLNNYGTINNDSNLVIADGATFNNFCDHTLNNYGMIVNNGTLLNGDGGSHDGRLNNHEGAVIENNGTIINSEGSVINNDGTIEGNGIVGDGIVNGEQEEAAEEGVADSAPSAAAVYALRVAEDITGGTVRVQAEGVTDLAALPAGTDVSLIPEAEEGYEYIEDSLAVTDALGERVLLTLDVASGAYTFAMPAGDVTVTAAFEEEQGEDVPAGAGGDGVQPEGERRNGSAAAPASGDPERAPTAGEADGRLAGEGAEGVTTPGAQDPASSDAPENPAMPGEGAEEADPADAPSDDEEEASGGGQNAPTDGDPAPASPEPAAPEALPPADPENGEG